ncbi:MAG TPA: hypothetical protein VF859_00535 [Burkholderiales bacterium]
MQAALLLRRYALWLLAGTAALIALAGLFNRVVDPFWYYRDISIEGFNAVKTKFRRFERHVKPAILAREKPEAITLGSSFAEVGFDPENPAFTDNGRLRGYAFAVAGADWGMVSCYLDYALRHAPIRRVVAGIHTTDNPAVECDAMIAGMGNAGPAQLLFSARALHASVQTVMEQRKERPSHTAKGRYFYTRFDPGADGRFRELFNHRLRTRACDLHLPEAGGAAPPPRASPKRALDLEGLRRMVRLARERGFELRLVVYPTHVYALEMDELCGEEVERWDALRQMAEVVEQEAAGSDAIQLWEFLGYNAVTGEPVTAMMKWWQNPFHFNAETGDLVLGAMFGRPVAGAPEFGRRVTSAAVADRRRAFEAERQAFIRDHSDFYLGLRALLPASAAR